LKSSRHSNLTKILIWCDNLEPLPFRWLHIQNLLTLHSLKDHPGHHITLQFWNVGPRSNAKSLYDSPPLTGVGLPSIECITTSSTMTLVPFVTRSLKPLPICSLNAHLRSRFGMTSLDN
jgi:hypothetical protein